MYDALIIGSGFGGAMAAHRLVRAGWRVLLVERGDWVPRDSATRNPGATMIRTPYYSTESAYHCLAGGEEEYVGSLFCVGGPSVFYGGASFRMREDDFRPDPVIVNNSKAAWPFGYDALEPYYGEAERILGVAGDDSDDPTRPPRGDPYPCQPPPLAPIARHFRDAALEAGLHPFPIPLAINFSRHNGRRHLVVLLLIVHLVMGFRRLREIDYYRDDPLVLRLMGLRRLPDVSTISRALCQMEAEGVEKIRELSTAMVIEGLKRESL